MIMVCKCILNDKDESEILNKYHFSRGAIDYMYGYWHSLLRKDRSEIVRELEFLEIGEENQTLLQNRNAFRDYLNDNSLMTFEEIFRTYKEPIDHKAFLYYLFDFTFAKLRELPIDTPVRKLIYSPLYHDISYFEENVDIESLVPTSVLHKIGQKWPKNSINIGVLYQEYLPQCDELKLAEFLLTKFQSKRKEEIIEKEEIVKRRELKKTKEAPIATTVKETDTSWENLKIYLKNELEKAIGPKEKCALRLFKGYQDKCNPNKLARFLSICLLDKKSKGKIQKKMKLFLNSSAAEKVGKKSTDQNKQAPSTSPKVETQPQETPVPWDAIVFCDSYVHFMDFRLNGNQVLPGQHYFSYPCKESRASFNYIKPHFANRLPQIKAMMKGYQVVGLISKLDLLKAIRMLKSQEDADDWEVDGAELRSSHGFDVAIQYDKDKMLRRLRALKSACINKLIDNQEKAKRIVPCKELLSHTDTDTEEDAFIFTLKAESPRQVSIIFENVNECRATIKFVARIEKYEEALRSVYNFMTSKEVNKRQLLQYGHVDFQRHGILYYRCINHTTVYEWANKI